MSQPWQVLAKVENPKFAAAEGFSPKGQIRSTKQTQITKIQMTKTKRYDLEDRTLKFASDFGFNLHMKYYTLTYLVGPDVKEVQGFCEGINSLILQEGGILEKIERPQKKELGCPIKTKGQTLDQAFVCGLGFYLDKKKLPGLEEKLKKKVQSSSGQGQLLRYLLLSQKPKKKAAIKKAPIKKKEPKKVDLKEIEEKIAEIIGE